MDYRRLVYDIVSLDERRYCHVSTADVWIQTQEAIIFPALTVAFTAFDVRCHMVVGADLGRHTCRRHCTEFVESLSAVGAMN